MVSEGEEWREVMSESLGWTCTHCYISNGHFKLTRTCCIAQGTLLNVMWQPGGRGVWRRMDTCIHMAEFLCSPPETIITLSMGYTPIKNKKFLKKKEIYVSKKKRCTKEREIDFLSEGGYFIPLLKQKKGEWVRRCKQMCSSRIRNIWESSFQGSQLSS